MNGADPIPAANSPAAARIGWIHIVILIALVLVGACIRIHDLTKLGLWPDEFWSSVYMASGRGSDVLALPTGILFNPPPQTELRGAPPWWHIWGSLAIILHPPLYLILLRWWMDLFGTSDVSTRCFSTVASLASVVLIFDPLRRSISTHAGLIAAALLALAPVQINLSIESRPYTLLIFFAPGTCHALLAIDRAGASTARLIQLGIFTAAMVLTHYFSFGAVVAIVAFTLVRLRGDSRRRTILALCATALVVVLSWGPFILRQHSEFAKGQNWTEDTNPRAIALLRAIDVPAILLYGSNSSKLDWIASAVIAYLLPLLLIRRFPQTILWWLWIIGMIGSLLCYDLIYHARLLEIVRYISLASPALYAISATPLPTTGVVRWAMPVLILLSVAIATIQRLQEGPPDINGDWRGLATHLNAAAGPDDPIVFSPNVFWGSPGMYYLDFAHYAPHSHRPIMYLTSRADANALRQLKPYSRIWLVGPTEGISGTNLLPGWRAVASRWFLASGGFMELVPDSAATSRPASHQAERGR